MNNYAPLSTEEIRSAQAHLPAPKDEDGLVSPIPDSAPPAPSIRPSLGNAAQIWKYHGADGGVLFEVHRFDDDNGKQILLLTLWRSPGGGLHWRWKAVPSPRPLYGLRRLAEEPDARVVVVEGEKSADAAERLLPGFVITTSPNGSRSATKADWSPLAGRCVTSWPDADEPGAAYAQTVAELALAAGAASVAIVAPPAGVAEGWDAADAEAESWTQERAAALIAGATPFVPAGDDPFETAAEIIRMAHENATPGRSYRFRLTDAREADRRNVEAVREGVTDRWCACGHLATFAWPGHDGRPVWICRDCASSRGVA